MDNSLVIIGLVAVLWVVFMALRAPAAVIFFSLLVGQLLAVQLSDEIFNFTSAYAPKINFNIIQLGLLVLPVAITLLALRGHVRKSKRLIEAVPWLLAAGSLIIFADNYLPLSQNLQPQQNSLLRTYEGLVVSAGAILSLLSSWLNYPSGDRHKKKH